MKYVAVKGMDLVPVESGVEISGVAVSTQASSNVKADGKKVYSGDISVSISSAVSGGYTAQGPIHFTIHPSAQYASADGKKMLLEGDTSDSVKVTGYMGQSSKAFDVTIKVESAGQTSIKAE